MAKMKINLSGVKEFLFNHGEKVALGVCGLIAIVLGGKALLDAAGAGFADSGKPWHVAIREADQAVRSQIASAPLRPVDMSAVKEDALGWPDRESNFVQVPYAQLREDGDFKRRNPAALRMLDDPKSFRLDYIRGLVLVHEFDAAARTVRGVAPASGGAGGMPGGGMAAGVAAPPPGPKQKGGGPGQGSIPDRMKKGQAQRFVVVQGVFPMQKQVEEFRKALKLTTQKELFDQPREDLPKILGINVVRYELTKIGGELVEKEPRVIVDYDRVAKKLKLQPALEKLLREAMYDEDTPEALKAYLYEGLAMPLPKLAYGSYPKFQFPGWDIAWGDDDQPEKKDNPMGKKPLIAKEGGGVGPVLPGAKKGKQPGGNPMLPTGPMNPGGGGGVELEVKTIKDKDVDPILSGRLFGNPDNKDKRIEDDFNVFHVLGEIAALGDEKPAAGPGPAAAPGMVPGMGAGPNQNRGKYFDAWDIDPPKAGPAPGEKPMLKAPKGGAKLPNPKDPPAPASFPAWERDALVRFIDADVHPGKTYSYAIQVRIANPNYKKEDKVAAAFLATVAELQDNFSWVTTPSITIPPDYFLYAMDQYAYDEAANPAAKKDTRLPKDATTFQIHQWITEKMDQEKAIDQPYVIGDWVVVERQVVRKGERIGTTQTVPVVTWNKMKETFETLETPATKKEPKKVGVRIKLKNEEEAPVLVDFSGGRRLRPNNSVEEETAVEALILTADGKLRVHNSRDDAEAKQPEAMVLDQAIREVSRQERWVSTRNRVLEFLQGPPPTLPKLPGK